MSSITNDHTRTVIPTDSPLSNVSDDRKNAWRKKLKDIRKTYATITSIESSSPRACQRILQVYSDATTIDSHLLMVTWLCLGKAHKKNKMSPTDNLELLIQDTSILSKQMNKSSIANLCYGISLLADTFTNEDKTWIFGLLPSVINQIFKMTMQEIVKTTISLTALDIYDARCMYVLAQRVEALSTEMTAPVIAIVVSSFAFFNVKNLPLMRALASRTISIISEATLENIVKISKAFAILGVLDRSFMQKLAERILQSSEELSVSSLVHIALSFAKLNYYHEPLLWALALKGQTLVHHFNSHDVVILAWSFAALRFRHDPLMCALEQQALRHASFMTPEDVQHLLWSYSSLDIPHDSLRNTFLPHPMTPLSPAFVPPLALYKKPKSTDVQQEISSSLHRLKIAHACDVQIGIVETELYITPLALVIEIDGPFHAIYQTDDQMREFLIRSCGFSVLHIAYQTWNSLATDKLKDDFLLSLLRLRG